MNRVCIWEIYRCEGILAPSKIGSLPGYMTEDAVVGVLARLCCRGLTELEIIGASLGRNHKRRSVLLDRIGADLPIQVGHGEIFYIAQRAQS